MAHTYSLISSYTVGSSGIASVSFLNIPQTYTDLILKTSCRLNGTGAGSGNKITINNITDSYTTRNFFGDSSIARSLTGTFPSVGPLNGTTEVSNVFSVSDTYIPNYTSSNYKTLASDFAAENNNTTSGVYVGGVIILWSNASPITSITLTPEANSYVQHSTFQLYGIKNEV